MCVTFCYLALKDRNTSFLKINVFWYKVADWFWSNFCLKSQKCIFCCKNVDQLPSLSWTLAIVSGWDGGIRFILWKLTSWSTIFNCHVRPAPPIKAVVCQFSSISSAPPGAHLTAACCANSSYCRPLSANQFLIMSPIVLGDSGGDKFSTSQDPSIATVSAPLSKSLIIIITLASQLSTEASAVH